MSIYLAQTTLYNNSTHTLYEIARSCSLLREVYITESAVCYATGIVNAIFLSFPNTSFSEHKTKIALFSGLKFMIHTQQYSSAAI